MVVGAMEYQRDAQEVESTKNACGSNCELIKL